MVFERFTDGARSVVTVAQEEARILRHHYLGTEHLLLGLLHVDGVASVTFGRLGVRLVDVRRDIVRIVGEGIEPVPDDASALRSIGIDLDEVRSRVEEMFGPGALDRPGPGASRRRRGRCDHDAVRTTGRVPLTPRAKKVLELSLREALRLRHRYIGTEHILLGLVREGEGVAAQILTSRGGSLDRVRDVVEAELARRGQLPGRSA